MRKWYSIFLLCLAISCGRPEGLLPGDLLFQVGEGGMTEAIEASTDGAFSHVGIWSGEGVWEAVPKSGVRYVSLRKFLGESARDASGKPFVRVYRLAGGVSWPAILSRLQKLEGRPYDYAFLPGTEALYCSELVYECYRDSLDQPVFDAIPMTFKGPDGKTVPYWISHYEALGVAIPEGAPGTNPNDLSRSPLLIPVPVQW